MTNKSFAQENVSDLPKWAKGLIVVAGLGLVAFVIYKVNKAVKDNKQNKGEKKEDVTLNKEFDKLNSNPSTKASLSKIQMLGYANSLFEAMDGYGTQVAKIYAIFTDTKNLADVVGISAAYGIREVSSGRANPEPNTTGGLSKALTSELSPSEQKALNMILAKKGINYKF